MSESTTKTEKTQTKATAEPKSQFYVPAYDRTVEAVDQSEAVELAKKQSKKEEDK